MTASGRPPADTEGLREALRERLWQLLSREQWGITAGAARVAIPGVDPSAIADALLPVVEAHARRVAAEELTHMALVFLADARNIGVLTIARTYAQAAEDCKHRADELAALAAADDNEAATAK